MSDEERVQLALLTFPECPCAKDKDTCWELSIFADRSIDLVCIRCWTRFDFIDEEWMQS